MSITPVARSVSNAPVDQHTTKVWRQHGPRLSCHLKQCACRQQPLDIKDLEKSFNVKLNPFKMQWSRWQGSNLTSRLLAAISSFHIFESRTCGGIKGSQSRSSGSSLPLSCQTHCSPFRPHHCASFHQHGIIHERHMPPFDKSPCVTPTHPTFSFNTNKHSDPHLRMSL